MLPKTPGFHKVSIEKNARQLFDFRAKVAKLSPYVLSIRTQKKFLDFFTVEHKSQIYIYNDDRGNLIGYFSVQFNPDENSMEILSMHIYPVLQRSGYGTKMMGFAEELAKKDGLIKIKVVTNIKNLPAVEFYKNTGFKIIKEAKNYYGDGETRYIFEKKVSDDFLL